MSRRFWAWAVKPLAALLAALDRLVCLSVERALGPEQGPCPEDHYTPLSDLMDGPEQLGDDTLAMVAETRPATEMWDSFEEADVHGIEVDDTAAEADMSGAHGPAVLAEFAEDVVAWLAQLDSEAWLGERGWL